MIKYVAAFVAMCGSFAPVGQIAPYVAEDHDDWDEGVALQTEIMDEVAAGDESRYFVFDDSMFEDLSPEDAPFVANMEVTLTPGESIIF